MVVIGALQSVKAGAGLINQAPTIKKSDRNYSSLAGLIPLLVNQIPTMQVLGLLHSQPLILSWFVRKRSENILPWPTYQKGQHSEGCLGLLTARGCLFLRSYPNFQDQR